MITTLLLCLLGAPAPSLPGLGVDPGFRLPLSSTERSPADDIAVQVGLDSLKVNGRKVVDLRQGLVPARARAGGRADSSQIVALYLALRREREGRRAAPGPDEDPKAPGRVNVAVDQRVPYRTLVDVLYTAGLIGLGDYVLVVQRPDRTLGAIRVSPPPLEPPAAPAVGLLGALDRVAPRDPALLLVVVISRSGFHVAGAGGVLAPEGADGDAPRAPTIPLRDGAHDRAALTAALAHIKERHPRETRVILTADPDIPYDTLIQTIDACREQIVQGPDGATERRPLFFDVSLTAF